jgi:hypothetical protein
MDFSLPDFRITFGNMLMCQLVDLPIQLVNLKMCHCANSYQ